MKGTKPQQKDMNILCLGFPNKAMNILCFQNKATLKTGGDFALEITKQPKKFFLAY